MGSVLCDLSHVTALPKKDNPREPCFVCSLSVVCVAEIVPLVRGSKVRPPIVCSDVIDVVNNVWRLFAGHIQPRNAVCV